MTIDVEEGSDGMVSDGTTTDGGAAGPRHDGVATAREVVRDLEGRLEAAEAQLAVLARRVVQLEGELRRAREVQRPLVRAVVEAQLARRDDRRVAAAAPVTVVATPGTAAVVRARLGAVRRRWR